MLEIEVQEPIKSARRYEFRCVLRGRPFRSREILRRGKTVALGYGSMFRSVIRFGYEALNFDIRHNDLWDSLYPLMFLTRNGGPIFNKGFDSATIRFRYTISSEIKAFYVKRAADFGLRIDVTGPEYSRKFDVPTTGHVLAFGGGKDSRMILGMLRELGWNPVVMTAGAGNVPDIPEALISRPLNGVLADRVMPALMHLGSRFYFGSGLGEAHQEQPWHQYYDWGSPQGLGELASLLGSLGVSMRADAPASVLPYNLIQWILSDRYPDLFRHQKSVAPDERSEKNLHVALCEYLRGIPFERHCTEPVFRQLLSEFVRRQVAAPDDFGFRRHREPINREMRAIIFEKRNDPLFSEVAATVPESWEGPWIHYIHGYVSPGLDKPILDIYSQYARDIETAPGTGSMWRIRP